MALTSVSDVVRIDQGAVDGGSGDSHVAVEALSDGGYAVAWREQESAGGLRIFARKFDASLNPVSNQTKIDGVDMDSSFGNGFWRPSIAALDGGAFAVEYQDYGSGTTNTNGSLGPFWTYVASFTETGALTGQTAPFGRPVQGESPSIWNTAITADGDGGYHYAFTQSAIGGGVRVVVNGVEVASEARLGTIGVNITDFGDAAFVTWQRTTGAAGSGGDLQIVGQIIGAGFSSASFVINTQLDGPRFMSDNGDSTALLSNGTVVVVWGDQSTADDATDPSWGVKARIYGTDGQPLTGEIVLPSDPVDGERLPAVAAMSGGRFIVNWNDGRDTFAQVYTSEGERLGDEVMVIPGWADESTMTVLADGRIVFAWANGSETLTQVWEFPDRFGTAGNDVMTGEPGGDVLHGLAGNDAFYLDDAEDVVVEAAGGGTDRIFADVDYVLGAGVHVETISTSNEAALAAIDFTGNELANILYGNAGANVLTGGDGNDVLDGRSGADQMIGGGGGDRFYVDRASDTIVEGAGGGYDRLFASASYALALDAHVEALSALVPTATAALNLSGSDIAQSLTGNEGANRLDGKGGADRMAGLGGDDTYVVDSNGDLVTETLNGGYDQVFAQTSYTLRGGVHAEVLRAADPAATAMLNLTGNELQNSLIGSAGGNRLDGKGEADRMQGLGGNDVYVVDNLRDQVVEALNGGYDRILASANVTLADAVHVEAVSAFAAAGTAALNFTGNRWANSLSGNAGNNQLSGKDGNDVLTGLSGNDLLSGGLGNDRIDGGAGLDNFYFDTALDGARNVDTLVDFAAADDTIRLNRAVFGGVGPGRLGLDAFVEGASAQDAEDRIVYDQATGRIFYDADGVGGAAATLFARVAANTILSNEDFVGYGAVSASGIASIMLARPTIDPMLGGDSLVAHL